MKRKQLFVLAATVVSIAGIYLVNAGLTPLKQTGAVAGDEGGVINYTLPPGFIFSIWGLIYLGFLAYALYGLKPSAQQEAVMNHTAYPVAVSILLNLLWVVIVGLEWWTAAYPLQWLMLLLAIYLLKKWNLTTGNRSALQNVLSVPFALYAGWLTVAMIPFTADLLNQAGWDGGPLSRPAWAVVLYVVATVIVVAAYTRLRQPFFLLPLCWALFGFAVKFDGAVKNTALVLCLLLTVFFFVRLTKFYTRKNPATGQRDVAAQPL